MIFDEIYTREENAKLSEMVIRSYKKLAKTLLFLQIWTEMQDYEDIIYRKVVKTVIEG